MKKSKDYKGEAKQLRAQVRDLKRRLDAKNQELHETQLDRTQFRDYFQGKFKWFIELNATNKTPNLQWLVEDMGKFFNRVQRWYW